MTTTTPPGVASAPVVPATVATPPADEVDQFQSLWDAGVAAESQPQQQQAEEDGKQDLDNAAVDGETTAEQAAESPEQVAEATEKEPEAKEYASLDEYLRDQKLEPDSFMALPVAVKVDGKEQAVPLGELVKGYQLASASYARMNEAAQARQQIAEEQARSRQTFTQEQRQVHQALGVQIKQAQELTKLAQNQLLQDFQSIDWNHLRAENPAQYSALYTDFQARNGAIQQTLQQIAQAERDNAQAAERSRLQALPTERVKLLTARPEWSDPVKAQAAQAAMTAAGQKLGFTEAELNGVIDHRQLLVLDQAARYTAVADAAAKLGVSDSQLLEMASKYAELQAAKPSTLKRVRAAPKMAAPGTRQVRDPKRDALQNSRKVWEANPRNEDAAAAYFQNFV